MSMSGLISRITRNLSPGWENYKALNGKGKLRWWGNFILRNSLYLGTVVLVIYVHTYSKKSGFSNFYISHLTIWDIVRRGCPALFLALGMGSVMILGGIDLSAGRILGLTACISASLLQKPLALLSTKYFPDLAAPPVIVVLLLAIAIGAAFGAFNGIIISRFKSPPFIATLSTQVMLSGVISWYVRRGVDDTYPTISGLTEEYKDFVKDYVMIRGMPTPRFVFYAIAAAAIVWFIWNKTTLGKKMCAVGANPEAAKASGIPVVKTTIMVFTISGMLYGFSGFIEAARIGAVSHSTGVDSELNALLACMIGGVSITGGIGKIRGIIIGVFMIQVYATALTWLSISGDMYTIIMGVLILASAVTNKKRYS